MAIQEISEGPLLVERQGPLLVVTLNRPDRMNALNDDMRVGLREVVEGLARDGSVRAMVLTGEGRGFCSGADLAAPAPAQEGDAAAASAEEAPPRDPPRYLWLEAFQRAPVPIVGGINGAAAGSGLGLAMACDVRVMGQDAFLYPAWTERGIAPDAGASWVMARLAGPSRALKWILNADRIGADEAFANGLADEVVETERVREASIELASKWASGATIAFGVAKRHVWGALDSTFSDHLVLEDDLSLRIRGTEDAVEGRVAFRERRKPEFKGR
jgi:2-(1,2-epoxy-1,2-dihydrophenyl)acetyl-CoA isomerase